MGQSGWSSPSDRWPAHPRPLAQESLKRARLAGWWLKKSSGRAKPWGVITCGDPTLPREERCTTTVMSTSGAGDGSETADVIDDRVRKCTHDRAPAPRSVFADAEALYTSASKCLQAALALREAAGHRQLIEDFLTQTVAEAEEAERLTGAIDAEREVEEAEAAASAAATDAGISSGMGPQGLAGEASHRAGEAEQLLSDEADRESRVLRARCQDIRAQAQTMLRELSF